ncbi:aminotransferase class I/II-fold pyridoxal phosphate-dependent enzyme [Candidatus Hodarchaeum mangrovi]
MPKRLKKVDQFPMDRKVGREEILAVKKVMKSQRLTFMSGDQIEEFEKAFAEYIGSKYAIAVSSGTAALHVALAATGSIGAGDEVLVPAYTFVATATAVIHQNAIPVFVDIDPITYCMDPEDALRKVTKRTKAIIPVHLFGHPANIDSILEIVRNNNLILIEDASQAHGAEYKGKKVGSIGLAGCFSLFESKNMMTGEGGIIVTNDEEFANQCRLIRHHGEPTWYTYEKLGFNYRMTTIQAAIGIEQLKKLDKMNQGRIKNSEYLNMLLSDIPGIELPQKPSYGTHVYHAFALKVNPKVIGMTGKEFAIILNKDFQITQLIYPTGLYSSRLFQEREGYGSKKCPFSCPFFEKEIDYKYPNCPTTDEVAINIIGLPNWHQLSYIELSLIAGKFLQTLETILGMNFEIESRIIGTMLATGTSPKAYDLFGATNAQVQNPMNVAVLGFGGIGQVHAAAYFKSPFTALKALATRDVVALQGGGLFFGITDLYTDYKQALKNPNIQAVSVCVPTFVHKEYIIEAAKHKKHILCEKPLLLNPNDYKEIKTAIIENNVKLMVAMICRFQKRYRAAKNVVERGEIGSIISIHTRRRGYSPPLKRWFWDIEKSGGIPVDLAIHDIDMIQWFLGDDLIDTVYAIGSNKVYPEIETWDTVIITMKSYKGVLATIEASWSEPELSNQLGGNNGMIIYGEDGVIHIDPSKHSSEMNTELNGPEPIFDYIDQLDEFVDQINAFAKAVLYDQSIPVSIEDGLKALTVAYAALESLKTQKEIKVQYKMEE